MSEQKRVFSGIQPTGGVPHVGNYVGALRNWVDMQAEYDAIYCVVDLHSMTIPYDPNELVKARIDTAKMLLALGIDPERSLFYYQSDVPQHSELAWILGTITGIGQLERMTQFKDKVARHGKAGQNLGLLSYPVLMAADILIHKAHAVPVGDDQAQHLEVTRDLAERFNIRFGDEFPIPERITPEIGARVMSLTDPTAKMSGSDENPRSKIQLDDSPDQILKKVKSAVTDSGTEIIYDPESKAGISNLLELYSFFSGKDVESLAQEHSTDGYGVFKIAVAESIVEGLRPVRERFEELNDADVVEVMRRGGEMARDRAEAEMKSVRERVGIG